MNGPTDADDLGVVVIGRNEGERLIRCLESVAGNAGLTVYVDSGSTDGSVAAAKARGAEVVELDLSLPFTAARARNAGLRRLRELRPSARFVQFVDGDCELAEGWLEKAREALAAQPGLGVVCGRRRERFPEQSVYNRLADLEWDTPVGEAKACGGDAMMRILALEEVDGFNPSLIAGEEPDLCVRLRQKGWGIFRLDAEMTRHDMAMTRFRQWWRRAERAGHAYAEGAALHGAPPERHWVRETRSTWIWGLALPLVILLSAWPTRGASLLLLGFYPLLALRAARWPRRRGASPGVSLLYGVFCVIGKFPQALGQLRYYRSRWRGSSTALMEYKQADPAR